MHDGFAGGAFLDTAGGLIGIATAAAIRGLGVVIPAAIAWKTAATVLEHGSLKRGYLGLAGQPVALPESQQGADGREQALLVVGVTSGSPAAAAGVLVGDVLLEFDGHPVEVAGGAARSAARRSRRPGGRARSAARRRGRRADRHRRRTSGALTMRVAVWSAHAVGARAAATRRLNGSIEVAGEFDSLAAARAVGARRATRSLVAPDAADRSGDEDERSTSR